MSDFDPYYKWLGIPPQEQPPNHYRLLGLQVLEQNLEVIAAAANRQMAYLQELSAGDDHIDEAQGLLGEVARARICLLAAESKARYDAEIASTLDSLPEAEEDAPENVAVPKFDSADRRAAAPRRPAARRSGGKKRGSTARRSGRRSSPTKNASRSAAREEEEVAAPSESSSLQIKIIAAAAPAVVILVIGIVWMVAGGDSSSKQGTKNDRENKTGSEASPGQGVEKDSLAAATTEFGNQAEQTASNRPPTPVVKPPKADSQPVNSKLNKPPEQPAAAPTENTADEPSETDQAEALLNAKGLEEGFNSQWELAELTKAYEETKNATGNQSDSGNEADFQTEFVRQKRYYFNTLKEFYKRTKYQQHPASDPTAREAAGYLNSVGQRPFPEKTQILQFTLEGGAPVQFQVPSDIPAISLTDKVQREVSTQPSSNPASNEAINEIAGLLRDGYQKLREDAEVQAALKTVEGNLAEPPPVEPTKLLNPVSAKPEQPVSLPADNANAQDDVASAEEPASAEEDGETDAEETPQEPAASFAELKDQLTALEKETKLSLGAFNKGAKEYTKQKKDLVKRIKAGEALYARRAKQQDTIQYPEKKNDFGIETDKMVTKPLNELKMQLQNLTKPDATAFEDKLKRAKKLLEQIKATPEYAANQKSIAGLAETIAKYHRGFNAQQAKMAK